MNETTAALAIAIVLVLYALAQVTIALKEASR